jgi:preprotein translocase subunit YajC
MLKNLNKTLVFVALNVVVALGTATLVLAEEAAAPAAAPGVGPNPPPQSFLMNMVPMIGIMAVFYFLMIRPQQKKLKEQQSMISKLKQGDDILTSSGILGKVTDVNEKVVTVEVADKVRVRMLKSQVTQVMQGNLKDLA